MPIPVYNNAHTLSLSPHRAYRKDPKIRLCKSLKIKGHFSQKIQGTYFKIYGLYFLQHALCFFALVFSFSGNGKKAIFASKHGEF